MWNKQLFGTSCMSVAWRKKRSAREKNKKKIISNKVFFRTREFYPVCIALRSSSAMEHISIRILITLLIKCTRVEGFKRVDAPAIRAFAFAASFILLRNYNCLILFRFHAAFFPIVSGFTQRKIHWQPWWLTTKIKVMDTADFYIALKETTLLFTVSTVSFKYINVHFNYIMKRSQVWSSKSIYTQWSCDLLSKLGWCLVHSLSLFFSLSLFLFLTLGLSYYTVSRSYIYTHIYTGSSWNCMYLDLRGTVCLRPVRINAIFLLLVRNSRYRS